MLVVVVRLQLHDGLFGLERLVGSSSTQSAGGASRRAHGPQPRLDARRRHIAAVVDALLGRRLVGRLAQQLAELGQVAVRVE